MFIAKISKGRTIGEFIRCVFFAPVLYVFLWMTMFGGEKITTSMQKLQKQSVWYALLRDWNWARTRGSRDRTVLRIQPQGKLWILFQKVSNIPTRDTIIKEEGISAKYYRWKRKKIAEFSAFNLNCFLTSERSEEVPFLKRVRRGKRTGGSPPFGNGATDKCLFLGKNFGPKKFCPQNGQD